MAWVKIVNGTYVDLPSSLLRPLMPYELRWHTVIAPGSGREYKYITLTYSNTTGVGNRRDRNELGRFVKSGTGAPAERRGRQCYTTLRSFARKYGVVFHENTALYWDGEGSGV